MLAVAARAQDRPPLPIPERFADGSLPSLGELMEREIEPGRGRSRSPSADWSCAGGLRARLGAAGNPWT
ncbi:hypothetical protein GCM10023215_39400 [Pseudonocardia yuanmonensis]|uniref:Uncharacterized protein n=1 Tax=Pseudonocardia yuanmonensis TaxID=1095914 RepID=A0ABP8WY29_9PSEU